jgi:CelD/BcsL family acetyltransferase involved in cellulose biosynthesis
MTQCFCVDRIQHTWALKTLACEWWDLWRRVPEKTPFQSPVWLIPWWCTFEPGLLSVVTVRRNGLLVALAPLYLEQSSLGRRLLPIGISTSDHLDVLVDPAWENESGRLLTSFLTRQDFLDMICFEELAPAATALRLAFPGHWAREARPQSAYPVLALPTRAEELGQCVPAQKLRKLRMARRRIGSCADIVAIEPETAGQYLQDLFRLHSARWNSRGEAGLFADEAVKCFHERALPGLVAARLVRLYVLQIGHRTVGVYYGFFDDRCAFAYLGGFDPAFAFASPGTILIGHAIEQAVREGATEFNFLRGREQYKYEWGAVDRWNTRLELRRNS